MTLHLLIVSLYKSLKRNKLESQCRYHKCIIEQKQTKITNLLINSDMRTTKQNSMTKHNKAMLRAQRVVQMYLCTDRQHLENERLRKCLFEVNKYIGAFIAMHFEI